MRGESEFRRQELPLLVELSDAGYEVDSVWDLVNRKSSYTGAIPVLTRHLTQAYHPKIREGIIRAMTVPEARGAAAKVLLDQLKACETSDKQVRFALANALTVVADETMAQDIHALRADPRYRDIDDLLRATLGKIAPG